MVLLQILEVLLQLGQQEAQLLCLLCALSLLAALLCQHEDNLQHKQGSQTHCGTHPLSTPSSLLKIQLRTCSHVQANTTSAQQLGRRWALLSYGANRLQS